MKLWLLSDLHLETVPHPDMFAAKPAAFDVLVSAGDIIQGDIEEGFRTLRRLAITKPVIAVLGNHEFWNDDYSKRRAEALAAKYKITLLDGEATTLGTATLGTATLGTETLGCIHIIGATLWTDYKLGAPPPGATPTGEKITVSRNAKPLPITIADVKAFHAADVTRLSELITAAPPTLPLVVVTHHAPHPACLKQPGAAHPRAALAASDLSSITDTGHIALWLHGHLHHSLDLIRPHGTRILCNPAGYRFENSAFDEANVIVL